MFFLTILFIFNIKRETYKELSEGAALLGVNGNIPSTGHFPNLEAERTHLGEKVLASNHAPVAQEFLKRGAPRALRGKLWSLVLGSIIRENVIFIIFDNKKIFF